MTAVERVLEYSSLKSEKFDDAKRTPGPDWPGNGDITFHNVSFSYDINLPKVLNELKFKIYSGEKIGIVGRSVREFFFLRSLKIGLLIKWASLKKGSGQVIYNTRLDANHRAGRFDSY
jgi:hypothetical protein